MNFRKFNKRKSWKPEASSSKSEPRCFNCNKKGHINPECPLLKNISQKAPRSEKKYKKYYKKALKANDGWDAPS